MIENSTHSKIAAAKAKVEKSLCVIEWSVASYGMISVRTDADKLIVAQSIEQKKKHKRWDIYEFESRAGSELHYLRK